MKIFKLIFIILLIIYPSISFAGKGYDLGAGISWDVNSGSSCPGKVLLDSWKNQNSQRIADVWYRSGSAQCYTEDDTSPTITTSGFENDIWVQNNVTISVSLSDGQSGLGRIYYYVNGTEYEGSSSFSINLTEEGYYLIQIYAYDKATVNGIDGSNTTGNIASKQIIVKIDKSTPSFSKWTDVATKWLNTKPEVTYTISDLYSGVDMKSKTFSCPANPENSTYTYPVINGSVTGICNPSITPDCSNDENYSPNASKCNWECNDGYIKSSNSCIKETIKLSCSDSLVKIPNNVYVYNKNQSLDIESSSEGKISWTSPTGVSLSGDFTSYFDINSGMYYPEVSSCNYTCNGGYHLEENKGGKCINDVSVSCCNKPPLGYLADTGQAIDCTIASNQNSPQCQYNQLCGGYVKDVLGEWNYAQNKWIYSDSTTTSNYTNVSEACGYVNIANSNGYVCNKRYYLTGEESTSTLKCIDVPTGEWSNDVIEGNQGNYKYSCTNKPNNSYYTSNGDDNNCSWSCNFGNESIGGKCLSYSWKTGDWSSCNKACDGGTKTRTVTCERSDGKVVSDSKCSGDKPNSSEICNTQACSTK